MICIRLSNPRTKKKMVCGFDSWMRIIAGFISRSEPSIFLDKNRLLSVTFGLS